MSIAQVLLTEEDFTDKLHARGHVGLDGLTTYKYKLLGNGQLVATYSKGERTFKHRKVKC